MYCTRSSFGRFHRYDDARAGIDTTREHALEERPRAGLVERLVEVAALRALDARGAARGARAALEQRDRVLDPVLEAVEAALGDPDAARVAVVDEDRRAAGLVVDVRREAADVPAVAHRPQREERDEAVLGGVQRAEELRHLLEPLELLGLGQNQIASVSKVVSGMSIGTTSIVEPSRTALRA